MDQMKPQLEIEEDSQLLYARMRHTKHYFASVKQLSQINSLNISLKQCSCVISLTNNGITWKQYWLTLGMDLQMISWNFFHLPSQNRLNDKQFGIFVDLLDTSTQKLVLLHADGGTGKTFFTCKIFEELALRYETFC